MNFDRYSEPEYSQSQIERVMETYDCDRETAQRYLDLRAEGYNYVQAQLMSGMSDPDSLRS